MKKVLRYLQDTAVRQNTGVNTTTYLSPPGPEPQQRVHHRDHRRRGQEAQHHREFHNDNHYPSAAAHTTPSHVSGSGTRGGVSHETERHQYASDNLLQSYDVYIPEHGSDDEGERLNDKIWIIFIHGGYYRDPKITASSFHRTLSLLLSSPLYAHTVAQVAGFASINYRLSAHPDHPQDIEKTPTYELRNARHPDHIDDVLTAITALQHKYGFREKYLLVGHSVGATMAFQVALSQRIPWDPSSASGSGGTVTPPIGILGVEGVYDFPLLVKSVGDDVRDMYVTATQGALGKNEELWLDASPAQYSHEAYGREWTGHARLAVVAHSPNDEMVGWDQVEAMKKVFGGNELDMEISWRMIEMKGKHDEVWEKGHELAKAIAESLRAMKELRDAAGTRKEVDERVDRMITRQEEETRERTFV